jgi:hypothetical protein
MSFLKLLTFVGLVGGCSVIKRQRTIGKPTRGLMPKLADCSPLKRLLHYSGTLKS